MKNTVRNFCVVAAGVGAMAILTAQAPPASQQPPPPPSEIGISDDDSRRTGRAAPLCGARFHRADHRQGNGRRGEAHRRSAVGRPGVRARVRHDSARHLPHDRADADDRDHRVRSLARARRRRRHQGIGQANGQHLPGRDASVQRARARRRARPRLRQRGAAEIRARRRTRSRTRSTRRRPTCAASRARS